MADHEDVEVVDDEQEEVIEAEQEKSDEEPSETEEPKEDETPEDGELVISIDGEAEPQPEERADAPKWVKELRKEHRAAMRELRELKAKEASGSLTGQQKAIELGEKPTLAGCDYDEEDFTNKLQAWHQRKTDIDARERDARAEKEKQERDWSAKVEAHRKAATQLRVPDYEETEEVVRSTFSDIQQAILLEVDNSAILAYAIGKRPAKAKELAAITNPVKFAMALAKLETQVKTAPRKTAPPPETKVRASAPVSGAVDSKLAKLMEEADRTGDRTKVAAYHRERRQQAA